MQISFTALLILMTVLISMKGFKDQDFASNSSFYPFRIKRFGEYSRNITSMFIHQDWGHLAFNMISLYFFGGLMEKILVSSYGLVPGIILYIILYFCGGMFAHIYPYIRNKNNEQYAAIGASGAISAVIFAAIVCQPQMKMMLLFLPIPIKAYIFGPLYLAFEYFAYRSRKTNIAHDAHLGGAIFGIIYILILDINLATIFIDSFK